MLNLEKKTAELRATRAAQIVANELAMCEPASPAKVVGSVATGSLPVSSVLLLLKQWEEYAARYRVNEPSGWWLRRCIDELRAEMARANVRQPEENIGHEPRPTEPQ